MESVHGTYFVDFSLLKLNVLACFKRFQQECQRSFHFCNPSWISKHPCCYGLVCVIALFWGATPVVPLKELGSAGPCVWPHQQRPYQTDRMPKALRLESLGAGCPIFRSDKAMDEAKHLCCGPQGSACDTPRCWVNIPELVWQNRSKDVLPLVG